jgi:hypothetical protein
MQIHILGKNIIALSSGAYRYNQIEATVAVGGNNSHPHSTAEMDGGV